MPFPYNRRTAASAASCRPGPRRTLRWGRILLLPVIAGVTLSLTGSTPAAEAAAERGLPSLKEAASVDAPNTGSVNRDLGGKSRAIDVSELNRLGRASASMFGLTGEGSSFVYVLDRSGSMGGSGRVALAAAKEELNRSIESLQAVQRFQVIFFNHNPIIFNPTGQANRLAFATEANVKRAQRFIDSITADGGTSHEDALKLAIRLRPDVIFFLSDAGEPQLTPRQLAQIHEWAAGIKINVIEFGQGPKPPGGNFLSVLARDNNGRYTYVDISGGYHGPRM